MTDLITRLRHGSSHWRHDATMQEAASEIERLRAALAAEQPEPVAWMDKHGNIDHGLDAILDPSGWTPLYASPPAPQQPLTDEQIDAGVAAWFATTTSNSEDREHPFRKRMRAAIERAISEKP